MGRSWVPITIVFVVRIDSINRRALHRLTRILERSAGSRQQFVRRSSFLPDSPPIAGPDTSGHPGTHPSADTCLQRQVVDHKHNADVNRIEKDFLPAVIRWIVATDSLAHHGSSGWFEKSRFQAILRAFVRICLTGHAFPAGRPRQGQNALQTQNQASRPGAGRRLSFLSIN